MEVDPTRALGLVVGLGADVEVVAVDDRCSGPLVVRVRLAGARPVCGLCGGKVWSKGSRQVRLADLPAFGRPARLVWDKRRWRCPDRGCAGGSFTEQAPQIAPARARLTSRAARWATRRAGRGRTVTDIAAELGCNWHAAMREIKRWGTALLEADTGRTEGVTALGLDEILMFRRGKYRSRHWGTTVTDARRGVLLDIVAGRSAAGPTRWRRARPPSWRRPGPTPTPTAISTREGTDRPSRPR